MSLFPLYDKISSLVKNEDKTLNEKHCFMISKLPDQHIQIVYLLILHHWLLSNRGKATSLKKDNPYNSRYIGKKKGLTFRINYIPNDLQKILVKYLNIIEEQ